MNQFGLVKVADIFSQSNVANVAPTADLWLDTWLSQSFAVPNGCILQTPVAVVNQSIGKFGLAVIQGLLQCILHKVCSHGAALACIPGETIFAVCNEH